MVSAVSGGSGSKTDFNFSIKTEEFLHLLLTELQNQDPLEPMSNSEMMAQVSDLTSLQMTTDLGTSISGLSNQNSVLLASSLLSRQVEFVDSAGTTQTARVSDVRVGQDQKVFLGLENGSTIELGSITRLMQ
ncbi:MAG: hypothetical protein HS116_12635 [Planctomycetes bacterium]|nr:hypothetical protein [Planctomycetota bacterium]